MFLKIGSVKGHCLFYSQLIGAEGAKTPAGGSPTAREAHAPGAEINLQV